MRRRLRLATLRDVVVERHAAVLLADDLESGELLEDLLQGQRRLLLADQGYLGVWNLAQYDNAWQFKQLSHVRTV